MTFFIDLAIVVIVAFCVWRGYKGGLLRGAFGFVALIAALFVSSIIASAYSEEFSGALKPFIGGIVDTTLTEIATDDPDYDPDISDTTDPDLPVPADSDSEDIDPTDVRAAYAALREIGLPESSASKIAQVAASDRQPGPITFLAESIADRLSSSLAFVAVFGVAFLMLAIIISVIGNLISFVFSLPGFKQIDTIAGLALGLAKGLLIVFAIAAIIRYYGLFFQSTVEGTSILRVLVNNNPIASLIGV